MPTPVEVAVTRLKAPIRDASELELNNFSFLFIGDSGTGKTSLLGQAADHLTKVRGGKFLTLNCERKERTAPPMFRKSASKVMDQPTWEDILKVFTVIYQDYQAGIGIDGLHNYARECLYGILNVASSSRLDIGKEFLPSIRDWYHVTEKLRNHVQRITSQGIPIICTALPLYMKDEHTGKVYKSVNTTPKLANDIPPIFDVNGICKYVKGKPEKYEIVFRPEEGFPARDTMGILAPREPADFAAIWDKLTAGEAATGKPTLVK
jgi:hypothetical protein